MSLKNIYTNGQFRIDVSQDENTIKMRLLGKSILRDPTEFMMPILQDVTKEAHTQNKRTIIDFSELSYMNSSTLTPIIKILEKTRMGDGKISLLYKKSLKWQDISFSALVIFQTNDKRIEINGL